MQNRTGAKMNEGSRHGMAKVGRQGMAKQGRRRQTQPADEMAGTGLAAKTAVRRSDRNSPCSKQPAYDPAGTGLAVNTASR